MKWILTAALLAVASLPAGAHATDHVEDRVEDAADDRVAVRAAATAPDARAVENAMADAFRASDKTARECSDRWAAYCDIADHAAGAVMMQAREKYEAAEFIRDR